MKPIYTIRMVTILMIVSFLMSCEAPPPGSGNKKSGKMVPTDEYNYIFSIDHHIEMISRLTAQGPMPAVNEELLRQQVEDFLSVLGYGDPKVSGKTDGNRIELTAIYPVSKGFENKAKIISKLSNGKAKLAGRVRAENLIGYVKFPGLESILDAATDYIDIMIDNDEGPMGKSNPIKMGFGAAMISGINLEEDLFSWLGDEMGMVSFIVEDNDGKKYASTAFAIEINNKNNAMDGLDNLVEKVSQTAGMGMNSPKILMIDKHKSFDMHIINPELTEGLNEEFKDFQLDMPDGMSEDITIALLYTNDFIFIGEESEVKQLADSYDAGGALGEKATASGEINLDDLIKYTRRYRNMATEDMRKEMIEAPEMMEEFNHQMSVLENYFAETEFGSIKFSKNFKEKEIEVNLHLTKAQMDLISFIEEMSHFFDMEEIEVKSDLPELEDEEVEI